MKIQWNKVRFGLALCALPLVASATAQQTSQQAAATAQVSVEGQRSHSVTLNRLGQVEGRIATGDSSEELNVYFVRDGQVVTQARTSDGGYFVAEDVTEGNYSFIATSNGGFVAYGVQVRPYDQTTSINAIEASTVSSRFVGLKQILRNSMPSQIAAEINGGGDVVVDKTGFAGSNVVSLNNGQLEGQVASVESQRQSVGGTEVFIIQNNREVARTVADRNGRFSVANLQPGIYDFIAAGSNGIAAVRFQATDGQSVLSRESAFTPVSFRKPVAAASAALQVCLTCGGDADVVGEQIDYSSDNAVIVDSVPYDTTPIEYASESVGCGSAVGGSCGSCGAYSGAGVGQLGGGRFAGGGALLGGGGGIAGGGGLIGGGVGGGFGRLISLGGLAGGIVALSNDESSTSAPVSPSNTGN